MLQITGKQVISWISFGIKAVLGVLSLIFVGYILIHYVNIGGAAPYGGW